MYKVLNNNKNKLKKQIMEIKSNKKKIKQNQHKII